MGPTSPPPHLSFDFKEKKIIIITITIIIIITIFLKKILELDPCNLPLLKKRKNGFKIKFQPIK